MKKNKNSLCLLFFTAIFGVQMFTLSGCEQAQKNTEIVFTTDFDEGEVFRIDHLSCMLPEVGIYMRTSLNQYESVFGSEIWKKDLGGITLTEQIKDICIARLAQIKAMNLLAENRAIELSDEEKGNCKKAAEKYVDSLSENERNEYEIDEKLVENMYEEYMLSQKTYDELTRNVNPEISDDEARTITVKHILFKSYMTDTNGERLEIPDAKKFSIKSKARKVLSELQSGADFDAMAEKYNEDKETVYSFGKGTMPESFEMAAFKLNTDELSEIVETEYGFHIIKCVSTFDRDETDLNKEKILKERKEAAFNKVYDEFVQTLYSNMNEKLWDSVSFDEAGKDESIDFFDVYNEVCGR